MATTTIFSWTIPTVGSDTGAWGGILNTLFEAIDTSVGAIKTTADAAMPKAGGTFTGTVENIDDQYTLVDKSTMSDAVTLDLATANFFIGTKSGAIVFTFSNSASDGTVSFFMLEITNGGNAGAITWPDNTEWPGGAAPTLTESGVDLLVFYTRDGGTTWRGAMGMEDIS